MKSISTAALAVVLALGGTALVVGQPANAKKPPEPAKANYSKAIQENLPNADKALAAGDLATAKTATAAAEAGMQTPDDKFAVGVEQIKIGQKGQDQALTAQGVDLALGSGSTQLQGELQKELLGNQAQFAYQARNYQKADTAFTQLVSLDPTNGDNMISLAEIKNLEGRTADAFPLIDQAIAAKKQAGQPVSEDWYKRAFALAVNGKNVAAANKYGPLWVQAFPSPTNWRDTLISFRDMNQLDSDAELDVFRLMRAAKALNGERDFYDYANAAADRGLPGEAASVITEGQATHMLAGTSAALNDLRSRSTAKVAADKASLPGAATRAQAAPTGKPASNTADAYLGYGDYAKAADLYRAALQKGGVDADVVNTRLGVALALGGQKAAALQAFAAVNGPARKQIANFWTIWANQQA